MNSVLTFDLPDQTQISSLITEVTQQQSQPILFKGAAHSWPIVQAAIHSDEAFFDYIAQFDVNVPVFACRLAAKYNGRFFYDNSLTNKNFTQSKTTLAEIVRHLKNQTSVQETTQTTDTVYMGSTTLEYCLPGLTAHTPFNFAHTDSYKHDSALTSLWLGGKTKIAAHYDVPDNLACVVAGKRQFTLFAPEQIKNLYPGPMDVTPAGQVVSLVDITDPDLMRFPRYKEAQTHAFVCDAHPGDMLYIPSLWWHHVEGKSNVNALINYWWRDVPRHLGMPSDVLTHALLSLAQLPAHEKAAWQSIFDHYIFNSEDKHTHIPNDAKGRLAAMNPAQSMALRAELINLLNK
ncbi:hypothetical protein BGP78_09850 [Pseudoalteromonas sp. MSK9-3]|uniref:cupin-like domain-containing protein n=1 Tax=Pseudoalteromonas sp. MSK9-3 TaxID=1897633 RepID=UPI000E6B5BF1|nr:cupin-like domain-containing protein [Pseudoalteromonas sp. MSK9-3]RJE77132.1 hypothetical protein BGP78_09850 [Pseudoalteromonas sp. MSK9-3]